MNYLPSIGLGIMIASSGMVALLSIVTLCVTALRSYDVDRRLEAIENEWSEMKTIFYSDPIKFPNLPTYRDKYQQTKTIDIELKTLKQKNLSDSSDSLVLTEELNFSNESENLLM